MQMTVLTDKGILARVGLWVPSSALMILSLVQSYQVALLKNEVLTCSPVPIPIFLTILSGLAILAVSIIAICSGSPEAGVGWFVGLLTGSLMAFTLSAVVGRVTADAPVNSQLDPAAGLELLGRGFVLWAPVIPPLLNALAVSFALVISRRVTASGSRVLVFGACAASFYAIAVGLYVAGVNIECAG